MGGSRDYIVEKEGNKMSVCPCHTEEDMLLGAVPFPLIREARIHGVGGRQLLESILAPLDGQLKIHLERHPRECADRMEEILSSRITKVNCPMWISLLKYATRWSTSAGGNLHVEKCSLCQRDISQIRAKLPKYSEYYLLEPRREDKGD